MNWITQLKNRGEIVHIAVSGAGSILARDIWITPGASEYFSGFSFPYSREETIDFIGYEPEKFCSKETALEMAMVSYMKAYQFNGKKPVGIGVSASVATNREKRSPNRVFVAVVNDDHISCDEFSLEGRGRADHDNVCSFYAQRAYTQCKTNADDLALKLLLERPVFACGVRLDKCIFDIAIYPGAFNPVHAGHLMVADDAESLLPGRKVIFNIELDAPNKPSLSVQDFLKRAKYLRKDLLMVTKGLPLYNDKAKKFRDTPFVIGTDALKRMLDPKWGPEVIPMLYEFSQLGTTFLVSPRVEKGKALTLDEVLKNITGINPELTSMFTELPPGIEMSSTALRAGTSLEYSRGPVV